MTTSNGTSAVKGTVEGEEGMSYDYIVCGGGTSGCVVAARLAEDPNATVLLIEAGESNELLESARMVGGWITLFDGPTDWNLHTTPNPSLNNRSIAASRGRFLSGSSGVNGTLCIRGTKADYDAWGLPGWSGAEFWPYMSKAESYHPKTWFQHDVESHGFAGPIQTEVHDPAPITRLLLESFVDRGMPFEADMFGRGEKSVGCGHAVRTVHRGVRSMAADYLKGCTGGNLVVWTETVVDKVNLVECDGGEEDGKALRAESVDVVRKDGGRRTIKARKEIVVSGGAYCSPTILLRSGIGPKEELENLGIESEVDLPGVGKNLMDHMICFIFYESLNPSLTLDHFIYPQLNFDTSLALWRSSHSGVFSIFPFGAIAYSRFDDSLKDEPLWTSSSSSSSSSPSSSSPKLKKDAMGLLPTQPNAEFFTIECYGGPKQYTDYPMDGNSVFGMISMLCAPRSRGSVTLKSRDCAENPVVDHRYLSDELDLLVLAEACRVGNDVVMKGKGTKGVVKGSWPPTESHHMYKTQEDWVPYVKQNATTCYHPGSTCKMGKNDDLMAVLDERLRVRGVKGLRVADVSVMPTINNGHTQMPAYGIGEKCAEMMKEDDLGGLFGKVELGT